MIIEVTQATFLTYDGEKIQIDFNNLLFREPKWKIKELLLDKYANLIPTDPIVKLISIKYKEYGKD